MDIKQQIITEYLTQGTGYRKLAAKYGISKSVINRWVMIYQGVHNITATDKQRKYYLSAMNSQAEQRAPGELMNQQELEQKIALLEKQLAWEKLRADALDTMINVAEKHLNIPIRKKPGSEQSKK